jgi:lysophospholipase L1-like esterase
MSDRPHLHVLGDSISIQYGPHLAEALADHVHYSRKGGDDLPNDLDTAGSGGVNGGDSSMCIAYLQAVRDSQLRPDVLLFNCGLHDIKSDPKTGQLQVPPEAYEQNLRTANKLIHELGASLVWVTTTPVDEARHNRPDMPFHRHNEHVQQYNAIAKPVMAEAAIGVIDLHAWCLQRGESAELLHDGRHFHEAIQAQQGRWIAEQLLALPLSP